MNKQTLILIFAFILVINSQIIAQDTTGQQFQFGYEKNKSYTYLSVNQDVVRNANDFPLNEEIDSFLTVLTLKESNKLGYIVELKLSTVDDKLLDDPMKNIPLSVALDSNGKFLELLNWHDYQVLLFKEIDNLFYAGVYDSMAVYKAKFRFRNKESIKTQVSTDYEEFFTLFGRQLALNKVYFVGKDIYYPYSQAPFIAGGTTVLSQPVKSMPVYKIKTNIGNKEEERSALIAKYEEHLKLTGQYTPDMIVPGVDLVYASNYDYDYKQHIIKAFYYENAVRVGDESRTVSFTMKYIK